MSLIPLSEEKRKRSQSQFPQDLDHILGEGCRSITSFEDFSNEVFYEVVDYLEGYDLYRAFSNLNHRFDQFLHSPSLRWKIQIRSRKSETLLEKYEQIIRLHKDQIYSINIGLNSKSEKILSLRSIDSSLQRLKSFSIHGIQPDDLILLLGNLAPLPRLFSLIIELSRTMTNPNEIYPLIFAVPVLKRCKLTFYEKSEMITFPMVTNEQSSSVEDLHLTDGYTFDELARIVSYTPELRRLTFFHEGDDHFNIPIIPPIRLSNLTHLTIYRYHSTFNIQSIGNLDKKSSMYIEIPSIDNIIQ